MTGHANAEFNTPGLGRGALALVNAIQILRIRLRGRTIASGWESELRVRKAELTRSGHSRGRWPHPRLAVAWFGED
jgi:hypothetical protein